MIFKFKQKRISIIVDGQTINVKNGEYNTDDPQKISAIKNLGKLYLAEIPNITEKKTSPPREHSDHEPELTEATLNDYKKAELVEIATDLGIASADSCKKAELIELILEKVSESDTEETDESE